ncbi:MAG: phosphoadenylyl-sulfate reductase [Deltaproteobacteria bacterium]|nr:phosphoadenylyl-sulfate reductase [Deltaproteobacteria bacterium]
MTLDVADDLAELALEIDQLRAEEVLKWALERFHPRIGFASSFGAEDVVVIHLLAQLRQDVRIFTLDTGRLHEETYDVMERIRARYGVTIDIYFPDQAEVETLERTKGLYSFRQSLEARKECCRIRKVEPLRRALGPLDAWITGLRREQAVTRGRLAKLEQDLTLPTGIWKVNPIADWTQDQVWDFIKAHHVPYNALHDRNFPSIGCAPCTRSVAPGEDVRAGRWWWETPEQKECGLHGADRNKRVTGKLKSI